ncbi:30S ribosomal protein S2 [Candidatus Parcubacteria bacterium]|nr:30S ribosomal protein S2 [Candidatus Parcubacteria bacterium]
MIEKIKEKKIKKEEVKKPKLTAKAEDFEINIEEMAKAGVSFGHQTSRLHPKMEPYVCGIKNTTHIIDLEKTAENFKKALEYIQKIVSEGKVLLLVGTKIPIKELVKKTAEECGIPYVKERWIGGTFTNFETIKKRIEYYKEIERKKVEGELEKYTKKERMEMEKELIGFETKFGGIKNMGKLPEAIFVLDMKKDNIAVKEARIKGVKIVGIVDTNVDPGLADFPIPANDDSVNSIKYILNKTKDAIIKVKK